MLQLGKREVGVFIRITDGLEDVLRVVGILKTGVF